MMTSKLMMVAATALGALTGYAALDFGPGKVSEFDLNNKFGGVTGHAVLVGVSDVKAEDFKQVAYNGESTNETKGTYWCLTNAEIVDVEKNNVVDDADDYWCPVFTDLNIAYWGGWISTNDARGVDAIADFLRTNAASLLCDWSKEPPIDGKYGQAGLFNWIDNEGPRKATGPFISDSIQSLAYGDGEYGATLTKVLLDGFNDRKALARLNVFFPEYQWKGGPGVVGHAVTCCGYVINNEGDVVGLFIIDSDNDMWDEATDGAQVPNRITFCPVSWDENMRLHVIDNVFDTRGYIDTTIDFVHEPVEYPEFEFVYEEGTDNKTIVGFVGRAPETLVISNGVTNICESAFDRDNNSSERTTRLIRRIVIPNSVVNIGMYAFYGCDGATNVTIGSGVKNIDGGAFEYCAALRSISIPNSVTSIGDYAFDCCESATSITIGSGVKSIGEGAFWGCTSLKSVAIPDGVTEIPAYAFEQCSSLSNVVLSTNLKTIANYAFGGCTSLRSVSIPSNVVTIADYAFDWCDHLTTLALFSEDTEISTLAFYNDSLPLTTVTLNGQAPKAWYLLYTGTGTPTHKPGKYEASAGLRLLSIFEPGYIVCASLDQPKKDDDGKKDDEKKDDEKKDDEKKDDDKPIVEPTPLFPDQKSAEQALSGFTGEKAANYDGWILGSDSNLTAKVAVKTGAATRKGKSSLTVTIEAVGGKKTTLKGEIDVATGVIGGRDAAKLAGFKVGVGGISGSIAGFGSVEGAKDQVAAKDKSATAVANAFKGTSYGIVIGDDKGGLTFVTATFSTKGTAKVKVVAPNGRTASLASKLVQGEKTSFLPFVGKFSKDKFACLLAFDNETCTFLSVDGLGTVTIGGEIRTWVAADGAKTVVPEAGDRKFSMDTDALVKAMPGALVAFLPDTNLTVTVGKKWKVVEKAGKVVYDRSSGTFAATTANPSALKFAFTAKTGEFKGSFKVYVPRTEKALKSYTASVNGLWLGDMGVGQVTIKNVGTWLMTIE